MVFVLIPAGSYLQGAEGFSAQEADGKLISLDPFFLSKYEMTQGQWLRFTGANPSRYGPSNGFADGLVHPVEQVDWLECQRVVAHLGLQLPTGAQWEYAARAGSESPWWTGAVDEPPEGCGNLADRTLLDAKGVNGGITRFNEDYDDGWPMHAPVDAYRPNPFGLQNVMGNVWEWCLDTAWSHANAVPRPGDGLQVPHQPDPGRTRRELRGGSFLTDFVSARSTFFHQQPEGSINNVYGLRPARALFRSASGAAGS
jgi:formylglycine-generating enzyme required for sulfatase activity